MLFRLLGGHLLFSWGYLPCASKHELKSNEDVLHGKSWQRALISAEGFLRHQLNNPCDDQFEAEMSSKIVSTQVWAGFWAACFGRPRKFMIPQKVVIPFWRPQDRIRFSTGRPSGHQSLAFLGSWLSLLTFLGSSEYLSECHVVTPQVTGCYCIVCCVCRRRVALTSLPLGVRHTRGWEVKNPTYESKLFSGGHGCDNLPAIVRTTKLAYWRTKWGGSFLTVEWSVCRRVWVCDKYNRNSFRRRWAKPTPYRGFI